MGEGSGECRHPSGCKASAALDGRCLRHLTGEQRRAGVDEVLSGRVVDLRGLSIDEQLWEELAEGLAEVISDRERRAPLWCAGAVFEAPAFFHGWRFAGHVNFDGAAFEREVTFCGCIFEQDASFSTTRFLLEGADDLSPEGFGDCSADFQDARFEGSLDLNGAMFADEARFYRACFQNRVDLQGVRFKQLASFQETEWVQSQRLLGPIRLEGELNLRRAAFEGDVLLEVEGGRVNFEDTRFAESLTIRARKTALVLEHLDLTRPALVSLAPDSTVNESGSPLVATAIDFSSEPEVDVLPKILSLRDSNVLGLTIAGADLRGCLFQGVRNVDRLSIEGYVPFAVVPRGRSRRRIIYEESRWRIARAEQARTPVGRMVGRRIAAAWRRCQPSEHGATDADVQPDQLARIYRGLRKSLEESKDFAGASDLYYGEMEMRLRARSTPLADRVVIALYWALSGYGLRASRSLFALAATLVLFSVLFCLFGFVEDESFLDGLLHSARTAALFPQNDGIERTQAGEAFQILLRIIGPVLVGLSALALRSRIKR